jgi:uncharacterized phage-like protein YoqJ
MLSDKVNKTCFLAGHSPIEFRKYYPEVKGKGYQTSDALFIHIKEMCKEQIRSLIVSEEIIDFMFGGCNGWDSIGFYAAKELKEEFPKIRLHMALPFKGFNNKWIDGRVIDEYHDMVAESDSVVYVDQTERYRVPNYRLPVNSITAIKRRNRYRYMADCGGVGLIFSDGKESSVKDCIRYANKMARTLYIVRPGTHELEIIRRG